MSDSERVFVSYRVLARSPAAVRSLSQISLVTVVSFGIAWKLHAQSFPDISILGSVVLSFGIVTAVLAFAQLFKYISNRDEDIRVTDQSITWDSKTWNWEQVLQIDLYWRSRHVMFHLNNGRARTRIALLTPVSGDDPEAAMRELRELSEAKRIPIRDRGA